MMCATRRPSTNKRGVGCIIAEGTMVTQHIFVLWATLQLLVLPGTSSFVITSHHTRLSMLTTLQFTKQLLVRANRHQTFRSSVASLPTTKFSESSSQTSNPYSSSTALMAEDKHLFADSQLREARFWNREEAQQSGGKASQGSTVQREALILSLADENDEPSGALHQGPLPAGAQLLGVGHSVEKLKKTCQDAQPNALFVSPSCPNARETLPEVLAAFPSIQWVHARSAGIDFIVSDALNEFRQKVQFTNAKGTFSSTLAEYTMMACSYFAKDLPRLLKNKKNKLWDNYDIEELRGKTMGIIGYGDIGRACAKMASVYGMRIVALRRHPDLSQRDPLCDKVYGRDQESLNQLMAESDYIVCAAPATPETLGMINAEALGHARPSAVFINVGRGPIVDEEALIQCLQQGKLKGAGLDVFAVEPLPEDSPLWEMDNVLLSPHNMDKTKTFMHEATEFFVNENLPRFISRSELLNPVDVAIGY